jgi:hypothetical protein
MSASFELKDQSSPHSENARSTKLMRRLPRRAIWSQWTGVVLHWDIREWSFYREHCGYPLEFRIRWTLDFPRRDTGKF